MKKLLMQENLTDSFLKNIILEDLSIESLQLKFDCPSPLQNNLNIS